MTDKINVVGVRFKQAGKIYYFNPGDLSLELDDKVIVETARGLEYGRVVIAPRSMDKESVVQPLKDVVRRATAEDDEIYAINKEKEREAFKICLKKIQKNDLPMKLIDVEYTFDVSKIIFYFTAEGRVDFRELVKDLAAVFAPASNCGKSASGTDQDDRRHRFLRAGSLLPQRARRFPAGFHPHGETAESFLKSGENLRHLRAADVLPKIRKRRL